MRSIRFARISQGRPGPMVHCPEDRPRVTLWRVIPAPTTVTLMDPAAPTVLVVEDDPSNRALLTALLERAGYRAITASDGPSGLAAALEIAPDLVLLDVGLPGMDGLEICRRLRATPRTVTLPVVLLTGRTSVDDVVAGLDAGADDFLAKPFHEAELLARLRSARRLALVVAEMESAQGVVAALANAVEAKDSMTEHHCQRLAGLANLLATAAELDPVSVKGVVFGALLHDIGKIGVSDRILKKPGALTDDEWIEMRRHPIIGEQICRPLASSREFAPIVRHHHERWDGTGYPDRLKAHEIPIGARIVGLVDAFDAIIHERPYRDGRTIEAAVEEIGAEAGRQFDPDLVERFTAIVERDDLAETDDRLRIDSVAALRASGR
jgi:putative two-component system response regulator